MSASPQPRPRPTLVSVPTAAGAAGDGPGGDSEGEGRSPGAEPPGSAGPPSQAQSSVGAEAPGPGLAAAEDHVDAVVGADDPGPAEMAPRMPTSQAPAARTSTSPIPRPARRARLSAILQGIAADTARERVSIGDLVAAMPGQATAALLFLFAAPNAIPTPPGTSALLGLPMIYLSYQLMMRHQPWMPNFVASRSIRMRDFVALVNRAVPLLQRAERMLRPRLLPLVGPTAEIVIGAFCLILALSVALPIPLGNMLPALAVSVLALGVLERDGLWVIIGTAIGLASLVVVAGVVWAAIKAGGFLIGHAFS